MTMTTTASTAELALGVACFLAAGYAAAKHWSNRSIKAPPAEESKHSPKSQKLPEPDPLWDFDLATAHTRNHIYVNKTLRFPYFQTMAHQPMHINDWIEIDKDLRWYIEEKQRVIEEKGKVVIDSLPENDDACAEILELLLDYLPKRYPTLFERLSPNGIWNKVTDYKVSDITGLSGVPALRVVSNLVQDDFLMGREGPDGRVYFSGGLVAFPGFYLLSNYIGQPLEDVHRGVPYFNEKILKSVERTLKRFPPNEPFERTSWTMVDDRNLFWHDMVTTNALPDDLQAKDIWLRMDHQTFRKLPRSKGIAFGVHVMMKRLEDLADSPLVPSLLAKIHLEGDKALMHHKMDDVYRDRMMPYLRELTQSQLKRGLITEEDLDRVADFRELVKGKPIPNAQTSLSQPTESEIQMMAKKQSQTVEMNA